MLKNFWFKLFLYVVFYLGLSVLTFMVFETPFLFETVLAEELSSDNGDKKEESIVAASQQKSSSEMLWSYRWYLIGASLIIISTVAFVIYISSGSTPPPVVQPPEAAVPLLMPHVPGQTITGLIVLKPEVCIDPLFSKAMPDVISVDSNFFHADRCSVVDPNFIKGFRAGEEFYQTYLMPDGPYNELSRDFWIHEAQSLYGKVAFPSPSYTFLYTQVAVIPADAINYTVYHKVDLVQIIQDPGHKAIPRILTSYLFKDNEYNWAQ